MMPYSLVVVHYDLTMPLIKAILLIIRLLQPQLTRLAKHCGETVETLFSDDERRSDGTVCVTFAGADYGVEARYFSSFELGIMSLRWGLRLSSLGNRKGRAMYAIELTHSALARFLDLSRGYLYIDPQLCRAMRSKFDVRLYWLMQAHRHQQGFTMTVGQLRDVLGINNSYAKYAEFERVTILKPIEAIARLYAEGRVDSRLTFSRVYNYRPGSNYVVAPERSKGFRRPNALKFTVIARPQEASPEAAAVPPATAPAAPAAEKALITLLRDGLRLPEHVARIEASRVGKTRREAFLSFCINLREVMADKARRGDKVANRAAYVRKSLHRWIENGGKDEETAQKSVAKVVRRTVKPSAKAVVAVAEPVQKLSVEPVTETLRGQWRQLLADYHGRAAEALARATLEGSMSGAFSVILASEGDKRLIDSDFRAANSAAKRVLGFAGSFRPGLVMAVKGA